MKNIKTTERHRKRLEVVLNKLIKKIGRIQIGTKEQFPYGWRKAAKGRTVWRILEEAINQNLEKHRKELGLSSVVTSASEVSVYDCQLKFEGIEDEIYFNIKSAVKGARTNKDDISKAEGLISFYQGNIDRELFIATFIIKFREDMHIELENSTVMPIAWLPDIYVNPSNNGNLQSSKYKDLSSAKKRTNLEFKQELIEAMEVARMKRQKKVEKVIEVVGEIIEKDESDS